MAIQSMLCGEVGGTLEWPMSACRRRARSSSLHSTYTHSMSSIDDPHISMQDASSAIQSFHGGVRVSAQEIHQGEGRDQLSERWRCVGVNE